MSKAFSHDFIEKKNHVSVPRDQDAPVVSSKGKQEQTLFEDLRHGYEYADRRKIWENKENLTER